MPAPKKPIVDDPHQVLETFVTSVVDVALISGSSVAVTLGMRRHVHTQTANGFDETVVVNTRLVLTLDAAQSLVEAVTMMLSRAQRSGRSDG